MPQIYVLMQWPSVPRISKPVLRLLVPRALCYCKWYWRVSFWGAVGLVWFWCSSFDIGWNTREILTFRQCIPKRRKNFEIKLYKPCDGNGHKYDMAVYWEELLLNVVSNITATHETVMQLTRKVEAGVEHRL